MLKRNQKALQVFIDGQWRYVFCRLMPDNKILTTADRAKALPAIDLDYFQSKFANNTFRATKE